MKERNHAFPRLICILIVCAAIFSLVVGCDGFNIYIDDSAGEESMDIPTRKSLELDKSLSSIETWHNHTIRGIYEILSDYPIPGFTFDKSYENLKIPTIDYEALSSEDQRALMAELKAFGMDRLSDKPIPPAQLLNPNWRTEYVSETEECIILGDMEISKYDYESSHVIRTLLYQSYGLEYVTEDDNDSRGMSVEMFNTWDFNTYRFCISDGNFIYVSSGIPYLCNPLEGNEINSFTSCVNDWVAASGGELGYERLPSNDFYEWAWPFSEFIMVGESSDPSFLSQGWLGLARVGESIGGGCIFADTVDGTSTDGNPEDYTVRHEIGHNLGFYHEHERVDRNPYLITNMPITLGVAITPFDLFSIMMYGGIQLTPYGQALYDAELGGTHTHTTRIGTISDYDTVAIQYLYH